MFDSARSVIDKYIDTSRLSRSNFYSVEMERGENPMDLYYLCSIKGHYYVVFETDYIMNTLDDVAQEAADIFKGYDLLPLHWLVRKDAQSLVDASTIPVDAGKADEHRDSLVTDKNDSPFIYKVRHAVIEFTSTKNSEQHRFHPNTYGNQS